MRLRVGAVLCLFLAFWGAGCRKALAPNLDNQAPETWIVAAPQDTITIRDPSGPVKPNIGRIPVRFHMYWAGSDRDGAVVGYYFAVVETLPVPQGGASTVPGLPGPKARDYRFTTKSDSIFIFHASEEVSERQHAFYIYAVDNKGRPDATPARFVFSSYDRFPPLAVIDELKGVGTIYELLPLGGVRPLQRTYFVRDSFEISDTHVVPRDTIPANSRVTIRWHGEPTVPSTVVTGYRYKLDETAFNTADSSRHEAAYNTGVGLDKLNTGQKLFTLRALGQSGWRGESTRWFQMNFAPDTWFAGPDPNDPLAGWRTHTDGGGKRYWYIDLASVGWEAFQGVPGTAFSSDSATVLPALRKERRTFFEIYNDRLWLHQEWQTLPNGTSIQDTVHLNSWVVLPSGGFDADSPYRVRVNLPLLPDPLRGLPVTTPSGPNGSPIGFRIRVQVKEGTDPSNRSTQPSETTTYPVFDPASVFHQPVLNGYWGLTTAGKAYAVLRAEDGDNEVDRRVDRRQGDGVGIVDRVDPPNGCTNCSLHGPIEDQQLRSKILTFFVDKAPTLRKTDPSFVPRANGTSVFSSRTIALNIPADDVDQLDPNAGFSKVGGTPSYPPILRRKIAILGDIVNGRPTTCYVDPGEFNAANNISITIPAYIHSGEIWIVIRLCDCAQCDDLRWEAYGGCPVVSGEASPGQGRCVDTTIKARLTAPEPADILGNTDATQRPGSPSDPGRRKQ